MLNYNQKLTDEEKKKKKQQLKLEKLKSKVIPAKDRY
jgi:hypothetical protein